jgi:hypothetical protein
MDGHCLLDDHRPGGGEFVLSTWLPVVTAGGHSEGRFVCLPGILGRVPPW